MSSNDDARGNLVHTPSSFFQIIASGAAAQRAEEPEPRAPTPEEEIYEESPLAQATPDQAGRIVGNIPLEQVRMDLLVRDRSQLDENDMNDLMASLQDIGLSNPIVVQTPDDGDGYELVQGFRRLSAFKRLRDQTGEDVWTTIPALILPPGSDVTALYRQMIDENLVRKDLSFAEMARVCISFAADPNTPFETVEETIATLFQSTSASKRSYIKAFVRLLEKIGDDLAFPTAISRKLGIALDRKLMDQPDLAAVLRNELSDWENRSEADEIKILSRYAETDQFDVSRKEDEGPLQRMPAPSPVTTLKPRGAAVPQHRIETLRGVAKFTLRDGKLDIRMRRDFSVCDPNRVAHLLRDVLEKIV